MQNSPSDQEVEEVIAQISEIVKEPVIDGQISAGFVKALQLLERRERNYNIGKFLQPQAREIAVAAVDFLNGQIDKDQLISLAAQ